MSTAAEVSGGKRILDTVAELVDEGILLKVFGFNRRALLDLIERGITSGLVERAWEALISDPRLVSIPQHLLSVASREEIAKDLAAVLARSPYYGSSTKKATALAHRVTANTIVTRASYYQFERASIDRVSRLMAEAFTSLDREAGRLISRVLDRLAKASPMVRERLLKQIAARSTPEARDFFARMDAALAAWRESFGKTIIEDARTAKRFGFQRAIDTLYHFEDKRNPWSRLSHPLSSLELGSSFFTHRQQALPIAEGRILTEARGLARSIRADMSRIILKEVVLKGESPTKAAAEILRRYRAALGERWGGARTSALRIARTEASYVLNEATRVAYAEAGVSYVDVIYTEGTYPCDICPPIADGGPYRIDDVPEGGIPFHPNCRCTYAAAFPSDRAVEGMKHPAEVFGAKGWAEELAKYGFVAVTASRLFGTDKPSAADREAVREVIENLEEFTDAEAPTVTREVAGEAFHPVTGYRRIEPNRFPRPLKDRFREVTVRDPVRAIYDLRKNAYEIGGIIRGNRILYYRGDESSVAINPVITASGGLAPGDVMFHTHPMALQGYMSSSMPSHADLMVHMHASAQLGDGARHVISGADGLREIRAEIRDLEKWRQRIQEMHFSILYVFFEELMRGSVWWATYGIRRALKNLEALDMGGRLVVSEPTTPGSAFIPLQPYVAPSRVSPGIVAELERRSAMQLRDLYERVAADQGAPTFRDRDYYVGLLQSVDPSRDWDEAAPTKTRALEHLRSQGMAVTGTRFSKEEIVSHLTGRPVAGKVYLDTSKIDYKALLGIDPEHAGPPIDEEFVRQVAALLPDEDIDIVFDHVVRFHGVPMQRGYFEKVAALEEYDPTGSHLGLPPQEVDERLRLVDVTRPPDPPEDMDPLIRESVLKRVRRQQQLEAWTTEQKRAIIAGRPVHGMTFLPDLASVWWGSFFPGFPEKPPEIAPTVSRHSKEPEWQGRDTYRSPLLYSNRQRVFKERWGITLREDERTAAWTLGELTSLDYALHLMPRVAEVVQSASRFLSTRSAYIPSMERLAVGNTDLRVMVYELAWAAVLKIIRLGYYESDGTFKTPGTRTTFLKEWLAVEPWRYEVPKVGTVHPGTPHGERAILSGVGQWVQPKGSQGQDPAESLALAITAYVLGLPQDAEHTRFVREHVFSGDVFEQDGPEIPGYGRAPVRVRRTGKVALI